jgi:hypothetical protein
MHYEAFRDAWESALRAARLIVSHERAEESLLVGSMARRHALRLGVFHDQPADPFTGSVEVSFRWSPALSARTETSEADLLTELVGRDAATALETDRPWLRMDITFAGKLAWGKPLLLAGPATWRTWAAHVADRVDPLLPALDEEDLGREGVIDSWLGEPEAQVRVGPGGELWLLGVQFEGWQAIELPRQGDRDGELDPGPEAQLEALAARLRVALDAWKKSLTLLLPNTAQLH